MKEWNRKRSGIGASWLHPALGLAGAIALWACVPETGGGGNLDASASAEGHYWVPDARVDVRPSQDVTWQPPRDSRVYVNTKTTLYYIDPGVNEELVQVADFSGPCTQGSGLYDIAVNDRDEMIGIAEEALYWVDTATAECTVAFTFPQDAPHFFSLSYVKGVFPDEPERDGLVAASVEDGEWVLIDFQQEFSNDIFVHLGYYDPAFKKWRSSGDIVSFQVGPNEFKTYATVRCENYDPPDCDSDWLVEVDPTNGHAMPIGKIGYQQIFGLGFWGDRLYGFTKGGDYIRIDLHTGQGSLVQQFGQAFWGAGNTTIPYIVQ